MKNQQNNKQLTQEQKIMDGVIEVDNRIPYQKIQIFKFQQLERKNGQFDISVNIKYMGLCNDGNYTIKRSLAQISDFIAKMHKQHPHLLLIPAIPQEKGILSIGIKGIQNIFGVDQVRKNMENQEDQQFVLVNVKRAFQFIGSQSFEFIYVNNKPDSPLFVFFQKNFYKLYSSKAYQDQSENSIWQISNKAVVNKFIGMLTWSSKKIQSPHMNALSEIKIKLAQLIQKLSKILQSVEGFCKSIQILSQNFLSQRQELVKRANIIYQKIVKINYLKKTVQLRQLEIGQIQQKLIERTDTRESQQDELIKKQLSKYNKYINCQINEFKSSAETLIIKIFDSIKVEKHLLKKNQKQRAQSQKPVRIDTSKMYDNYKNVSFNDK